MKVFFKVFCILCIIYFLVIGYGYARHGKWPELTTTVGVLIIFAGWLWMVE